MKTMTAEEILHQLTDYLCGTKYATSPEILRMIGIGGAIAFQLGGIPAYRIRMRMLGFDLNGRKFKLRFLQLLGGIVELVEWDGYRDLRDIRQMKSVKDTHGILADL